MSELDHQVNEEIAPERKLGNREAEVRIANGFEAIALGKSARETLESGRHRR